MSKKLKINKKLSVVFNQINIEEHAKKKSMWGGSFNPSNHTEYILKNESQRFSLQTVWYADSLYRNFDEVLGFEDDADIKQFEEEEEEEDDEFEDDEETSTL